MRVAIVGAGIVGTSIAHAVRAAGHEVLLVDREPPGSGCSAGNSGAISASSVTPMATPGVLADLPAMLLDPLSPLRVRPRYLPRALPWLLRFAASAKPHVVARAARDLARHHEDAVALHQRMVDSIGRPDLLLRQGHLVLYPDDASRQADAAGWQRRRDFGWAFETLDRAGIERLEPAVHPRYRCAMFLPDHATIVDPRGYVEAIARAFDAAGGLQLRAVVRRLRQAEGGWRLDTDGPAHGAVHDHVVVAAGAWSNRLLAPLGLPQPLESQRGYHVQFEPPAGSAPVIHRTVVLADRKVFLAPMHEGLRIGGTVEFAGLDAPPDPRRSDALHRIACDTFEGLSGLRWRAWMGHRPCTPDTVPIVGRAAGHPGLWLAIGHGHLGLTDSQGTARMLVEQMGA